MVSPIFSLLCFLVFSCLTGEKGLGIQLAYGSSFPQGWSIVMLFLFGVVSFFRIFLPVVVVVDWTCTLLSDWSFSHNHIWDLTAGWISVVYHDTSTEPPLQLLSGESLSYFVLLIKMLVLVWTLRLLVLGLSVSINMIFIPHITDPMPTANMNVWKTISMRRVCEIQHGSFSPLVFSFSTSGGWVPQLFLLMHTSWHLQVETPYCRAMCWLCCRPN